MLQQPDPATTCSHADEKHKLIAGPEFTKADLFITATGKKRVEDKKCENLKSGGEQVKGCPILGTVPPGTMVVSELPSDSTGKVIEDAEPGWFALNDEPALSGKEITNPKQERDEAGQPNVNFQFTDSGQSSVPGSDPPDRAAGPGAGDRAGLRRNRGTAVGAVRGGPRQRSQDPAADQLPREPGRDRRPQRRPDLGRFPEHPGSPGPRDLPPDRRPADQPEADQPVAGLGDARRTGAQPGPEGGR